MPRSNVAAQRVRRPTVERTRPAVSTMHEKLGLLSLACASGHVIGASGRVTGGADAAAMVGALLEKVIVPSTGDLQTLLRSGQPFEAELRLSDERIVHYTLVSEPVGEEPGHFVLSGVPAAPQRRTAELERLALYDGLTGLANRTLFQDRLRQALAIAQRNDGPVALLLFDLDRFKEVNDTLGHDVGDDLIKQVGVRLAAAARESETVARLGGDEFAVVLPATDVNGAVVVADRLLAKLREPFTLAGRAIDIPASVGIAAAPLHGSDPEALLRCADIAMYAAKASGGGRVVFAREQESDHRRLAISAQELRLGIQNDQIVVHYQPKVDLRSRKVCGAEALMRWDHPEKGLLTPGDFLPAAERAGLLRELSLLVLNKALRQAAVWQRLGYQIPVAVNVPSPLLGDVDLVSRVRTSLEANALTGAALILEVVESASLDGTERTLSNLRELRALGIGISLDDFGTGYASLSYLRDLPATEVKIARTFLGSSDQPGTRAIVESAVELAHRLGMRVVGEGVETETELQMLAASGCDYAQGFYVAAAMPLSELVEFFDSSEWAVTDPMIERRLAENAERISALAKSAWDRFMAGDRDQWTRNVREHEDELEIALCRALRKADVEYLLTIGGALPEYWQAVGQPRKYRRLMEQALALPSATGGLRARALRSYSKACREAGDLETARSAAAAAVAIGREEGGDDLHIYLISLGTACASAGDLDAAEEAYTEALSWAVKGGHDLHRAVALGDLGCVALGRRDLTQARRLLEQSVEMLRRWNDPLTMGTFLVSLAEVSLLQGDLERAAGMYRESIACQENTGYGSRVFEAIEGMAMVASRGDQPVAALQLAAAASALREEVKVGRQSMPGDAYPEIIAAASEAVSKPVRLGAAAVGRAMTRDEVVMLARGLKVAPRATTTTEPSAVRN